ncbi:MAG: hypothetical protein E6H76_16285 [Betaproteobacteria bacterium]|nr:MAG: hypothetical protein E6H76_16285 [Betaproteobacteria bacterium]
MWRRLSKPSVIVLTSAAIAFAVLYLAYRWVDPLPPRHFAIAAGITGTTYDDFARQYARILARDGVDVEVRNYASAIEHFDVLRDATSGVQAALTNFGFTQPSDAATLYSLGGISDTPIFMFYRNAEPITRFVQFHGKRLSIGAPRTALRALMLEVLKATGALDDSIRLSDLDYGEAIDALIAGAIDVATGLKRLVLWRGLIGLTRDIPSSDMDLLALRNRLLVRKDLHPALQYLLLGAMREVHGAPGPFNRLGEFPAEQPNDLLLSPTAEAFYRTGPTFWQRYTSFWLTSLLNRIVFFAIPVVAMLIPIIGFAPRFYRWLHVRRIERLHRALGNIERELDQSADPPRLDEYQTRLAKIESAVRLLKVARPFEVDLHRLRIHLRMVQEDVSRMGAAIDDATSQ